MPELGQRSNGCCRNPLVGNGSPVSDGGVWSKQKDDMSYNQLQQFWCELTPQARQKLLRIEKRTLLEHARKNMYCSRCNGLLLELFLQIVIYGKSLQQDPTGARTSGGTTDTQNHGKLCAGNGCQDDVLNSSVHPWGGLTTTKAGTLTLLDCYLYSKSLTKLQNVFDNARVRERERKSLYPDACGGGGRGWKNQGGIAGYGRGHGTREACALHTARLSVETLVDFWSALSDDTHQSLLRMKEEDFMERLLCRFDNKRFCRECRRNVISEFKELKELKRLRNEPRCTSWFCVADTDFQYEVSCDTVKADWHQTFLDASGTYSYFEWAIGTEEGKCDIMEFENVGLSGRVQVSGLDLSGLEACYITLRACKMDGRYNELCVKAHALEGKQCVHCRLVVGDGYLSITIGESIKRFFKHAEEIEEEEEDDSMEKDGNEFNGECNRPLKHAKSPELAQEFLLDAAIVIFKEQVEKAFREGTARKNAHNTFVFLALKLLEERLHVACKEIITSEKQMKLLEEEETEKREEEERKERRRTKERGKKLRRKEKLREKENKEKECFVSIIDPAFPDIILKDPPHSFDEVSITEGSRNSLTEACDEATTITTTPASPLSPDIPDDIYPNPENHFDDIADEHMDDTRDITKDNFRYSSRRNLKFQKDTIRHKFTSKWSDRRKSENEVIVVDKHESRFHDHGLESNRKMDGGFNKHFISNATKYNTRTGDMYDSNACSCNKIPNEYRSRSASHLTRGAQHPKHVIKFGNPPNIKQVWEPVDPKKKYNTRTNLSSDVALGSPPKVESSNSDQLSQSSCAANSNEANNTEDNNDVRDGEKRFMSMAVPKNSSEGESCSNSDNCSSCLSDGDGITSSSNPQNLGSSLDSKVSSKNPQSSLLTVSAAPSESGRENICTSSHPQSVLPQVHNQSIQYPAFMGPTMDYYHQGSVSWSAVPTNGLISFPYSNYYPLANSFFYGNAQFMQYMPPSRLEAVHVPVFPPMIANNSTQKVEASNETPAAVMDEGKYGNRENTMDKGNNDGFSLFHFGGPVALSTGLNTDNAGLNEGIVVGNGNYPIDKKDSVEEYNLFAASNGIKFSIF